MTERNTNEITIEGRLAFPVLWTPESYQGRADLPKQFGSVFLVEKGSKSDDLVKAAITRVTKEKWGKSAEAVWNSVKNSPQNCCYMDGDAKTNLDGYEGCMALSAKNKKRPTVVDRDANPLTEADGKPYAGCYVIAKVEIWAQQNEHGRAVRCSLLGVQFKKDGDSFTAGRVASADEFDDLGSVGDDEDDLESESDLEAMFG